MPLPLAAASLALGGLQSLYGMYQANQLNKQPLPLQEVTPEMRNAYARAEGMANQGYTPAEAAAFKSNLASSNALGYRNAVDMSGGQLSNAIGRGIQASNLGALNQFAQSDAGLRRTNMRYADTLAQHLQSISNARQNALMNRRTMAERAAGGALSAGTTNITNALNLAQALGGGKGGENLLGTRPWDGTPTPVGYTGQYNTGSAGGRPGED